MIYSIIWTMNILIRELSWITIALFSFLAHMMARNSLLQIFIFLRIARNGKFILYCVYIFIYIAFRFYLHYVCILFELKLIAMGQSHQFIYKLFYIPCFRFFYMNIFYFRERESKCWDNWNVISLWRHQITV